MPSIADVIEAKRARIKHKDIGSGPRHPGPVVSATRTMTRASAGGRGSGDGGDAVVGKVPDASVAAFYSLADELLADLPARDALAALAAAAYSGDLDPRRYGEVRDVSVDSAAKARLYVGLGKKDGVWPKDIAEIVKRLTGLPDRMVDDIEVLERFSFASVPFEAAEKAIAEARRQRGAPPVRIAAPKAGPGGPKRPYGPRGSYDKPRPYRPHGAGFGDSGGGRPTRKPR